MLSIERRSLILEALQRDKKVLVGELSTRFDVSEETIRRDLDRLKKDGYASRTYGGAILREDSKSELPFIVRKKTNVTGKQHIAELVAEQISDGDFIMLDESSTAFFVARAIKRKRSITLISNSLEIILEVSGVRGWTVMSTGGTLKPTVLSLTGHQAESFIGSYHVDKAVVSCTGLDVDVGYTDAGEDNALIKRAMMSAARQTILAVDSRKFNKKAFAKIGELSELSALVTDEEPNEKWKTALEESGVKLLY